ncbi:MAG: DUF4202 domain-containing protein [Myxococcales bacterium]
MDETRLRAAMARIDAANAQDPEREQLDGREVPKELLYAERMTACLETFAPGASEALRLAVRAQHLCRWRIPRDAYPRDRAGYLRWRAELGRLHAQLAGEILREVGYVESFVARVQSLVQKKHLRSDPEAQTLEDVACLVFLRHAFAPFAAQHDDEKVVAIVRKTWGKMSPRAREEALRLPLGQRGLRLVQAALADAPSNEES